MGVVMHASLRVAAHGAIIPSMGIIMSRYYGGGMAYYFIHGRLQFK